MKGFEDGFVLLDVHMLNEKVLKPILGIKNIRTDKRVAYLDGTKTVEDMESFVEKQNTDLSRLLGEGVCFCLYPVEFEDLKQVADSKGILPPKSTFFEPRMKNGLLVYEI